jgi:hypothetical protein
MINHSLAWLWQKSGLSRVIWATGLMGVPEWPCTVATSSRARTTSPARKRSRQTATSRPSSKHARLWPTNRSALRNCGCAAASSVGTCGRMPRATAPLPGRCHHTGALDVCKLRAEAPSTPDHCHRSEIRDGKKRRVATVMSISIADPDYLYAANLVIEHYGQEAARHCARRAIHLLHTGDVDGSTVWRRILAAIEELQRGRRKGEPIN